MRRTPLLAVALVLAVTGCGSLSAPSDRAPASSRAIRVTNQYWTFVDIHARVGTTVLQRRLARIPPGRTVVVQVPAPYFRASELSLEVCRVDRIKGEPNCVTTTRYQGLAYRPELVIRASERLTADLYGD